MASPYDTPPDGDFARCIEQLSRPPVPQADAPAPPAKWRPRAPRPQARPVAGKPFAVLRQVAQGALFVYVAWLLLSSAVPALVPWGHLVALAYLAFAFLRLRNLPWRDLLKPQR